MSPQVGCFDHCTCALDKMLRRLMKPFEWLINRRTPMSAKCPSAVWACFWRVPWLGFGLKEKPKESTHALRIHVSARIRSRDLTACRCENAFCGRIAFPMDINTVKQLLSCGSNGKSELFQPNSYSKDLPPNSQRGIYSKYTEYLKEPSSCLSSFYPQTSS